MPPGVRVMKFFSTNGVKNMADPDYGGHKVTMLYAGHDARANRIAAGVAAEIGFVPIYLGPVRESRLLERLAMAWIVLARHRGLGRDFALDVGKASAEMTRRRLIVKHKHLQFGHGFRVALGDRHSQAAQMTLGSGETASFPGGRGLSNGAPQAKY